MTRDEKSMIFGGVRIGPFEIEGPLGKGGMGVVFKARHVVDHVNVALKVLSKRQGGAASETFLRESQAMARLNHPGIAAVLDIGTVGPLGVGAQKVLPLGCPWLAVEFIEGHALEHATSWTEARAVLVSVLDALAHAHSMGVVHRDLKPANIVVRSAEQRRIQPVLVDFGISALDAGMPHDPDRVFGTPGYMAPEQIIGNWRDQGPWTDLYSVGCIAWFLVTGLAPFKGRDTEAVFGRQLQGQLPDFEPLFDVPDGVRAWLDLLLAIPPESRFQRAADAAHELRLLPTPKQASTPIDFASTVVLQAFEVDDTGGETTVLTPVVDATLPAGVVTTTRIPPLPPRPHPESELPPRLLGAGLGLFGMRELPLAGRERERQLLWQALRTTRDEDRPRVVLIDGPPGVGKTRLAEWLAHRSHELGATTVLHVKRPIAGHGRSGVWSALSQNFRCDSMLFGDLFARWRELLERHGVPSEIAARDALTLAQRISSPDVATTGMGLDRSESFAVLRRLLQALARSRPVLLWADDVDDSRWMMEMLHFLLSARDDGAFPLTVVATCTSAQRTPQLAAMTRDPRTEVMHLPPLDDESQRKLISGLLRLQPSVLDDVVSRAEGNPLFAVQLVGDWVSRGNIRLSAEGFGPLPGADLVVPDTVHDLWQRRLEPILAAQASGRRDSAPLELAATLGHHVDLSEWREACALSELPFAIDLLPALERAGLIVRGGDGFQFAHRLFRESLLRSASDAGRLLSHHVAARVALEAKAPERWPKDLAARIAHHHVEAHDLLGALDPYYRAAVAAYDTGEVGELDDLLTQRRELMEKLAVPQDDRAWAQHAWLRGYGLHQSGRPREAWASVRSALEGAREMGFDFEAGHLLRLQGNLLRDEGRFEDSLRAYEQALPLFEKVNESEARAHTFVSQGGTLLKLGRFVEARARLQAAVELFEQLQLPAALARAVHHIAYTWIADGEPELAGPELDRALKLAREAGNRALEASCWNNRGEVARFLAKWDDARAAYGEAATLWGSVGHRDGDIALLNLAMVEVAARRFDEAARIGADLAPRLADRGLMFAIPTIRLVSACCAAATEAWQRFDAELDAVDAAIQATGLVERDIAWLAELAGNEAALSGDRGRAARAWTVASTQWESLGEAGDAARLAARAKA